MMSFIDYPFRIGGWKLLCILERYGHRSPYVMSILGQYFGAW